MKSIGSVTRLSIWPWTITTSFGRSVPRWIATTLTIRVGRGRRSPVAIVSGKTISRQLPQAFEVRRSSASAQRRAAPIPRFLSVCDERVWRVPNETSFATSARRRVSEASGAGWAHTGVATRASGINRLRMKALSNSAALLASVARVLRQAQHERGLGIVKTSARPEPVEGRVRRCPNTPAPRRSARPPAHRRNCPAPVTGGTSWRPRIG